MNTSNIFASGTEGSALDAGNIDAAIATTYLGGDSDGDGKAILPTLSILNVDQGPHTAGDSYHLRVDVTVGGTVQNGLNVTFQVSTTGFTLNVVDVDAEITAENTGTGYVGSHSGPTSGIYYFGVGVGSSVSPGIVSFYLPIAPLYDGVGDLAAGSYSVGAVAVTTEVPAGASTSISVTVNAPAPTYTIDATSGKACPANLTEHAAFETANGTTMGNPDLIWGCQDASGTIADGSGNGRVGTVTTGTYAQAVTGWSRVGIAIAGGGNINTTSVPNANANSIANIMYAIATSATTSANVLAYGTTQLYQTRSTATPRLQCRSAGNVTTGTGAYTGSVRPFAFRADRTNAQTVSYSDQEKITATHATTPTGAQQYWGGVAMTILYGLTWFSSKTEAQVKAWLQAAGWSIPGNVAG